MGLDLFWGYSELCIQDGFLFEGEGVEPNKNAAGKTPCCFQLLERIEVFTNVSVAKAGSWGLSQYRACCVNSSS